MKITISAEIEEVRSGWEARAPALRLASHGSTQELALRSLQGVLSAYFNALRRAGILEQTLTRASQAWAGDDGEIIVLVRAVEGASAKIMEL